MGHPLGRASCGREEVDAAVLVAGAEGGLLEQRLPVPLRAGLGRLLDLLRRRGCPLDAASLCVSLLGAGQPPGLAVGLVGRERGRLDREARHLIAGEKRRVHLEAPDAPWDAELDDAPVMAWKAAAAARREAPAERQARGPFAPVAAVLPPRAPEAAPEAAPETAAGKASPGGSGGGGLGVRESAAEPRQTPAYPKPRPRCGCPPSKNPPKSPA
mmetsp:Transcript_10072/g.23223  ORF Transcript_10072/g.23223 Transcript_10072/m.23223 type:complete len:214 (-) Transcript_10072:371-1012(-)